MFIAKRILMIGNFGSNTPKKGYYLVESERISRHVTLLQYLLPHSYFDGSDGNETDLVDVDQLIDYRKVSGYN